MKISRLEAVAHILEEGHAGENGEFSGDIKMDDLHGSPTLGWTWDRPDGVFVHVDSDLVVNRHIIDERGCPVWIS